MSIVINQPTSVPMVFLDVNGTGKTGLSITASARLSGTTTIVQGTVTEQTNGAYDASITFPTAGTWLFQATTTIDGSPSLWVETLQVDATLSTTLSVTLGFAKNRLSDIRSAVARMCDDWVEFIATSDSADTTVLTDVMAGYENDQHFRGSELWFVNDEGTIANRGIQVRCVDSDRDLASLTLGPGLVSSPVLGDKAWAYNIGGEGSRIRTYDATINDAIRSLGVAGAPVYSEVLSGAWDRNVYWVDIPDAFSHISGMQYVDTNGNYIDVPSYGLDVDLVNKRVSMTPDFAAYASGYSVRLNGRTNHPKLTLDTDATDVDFEWLTYQCSAAILMNMQDQLKANKGGLNMNRADELRGKAGPFPFDEGLIRVR